MFKPILNFLRFVSTPNGIKYEVLSVTSKLRISAAVLIWMFVVNLCFGLLQTFLVRWEVIGNAISSFQKPAYIASMPAYAIFLEFVIIAPVLEELAFRGLLQQQRYWIRASLSVILYLAICRAFGLNFYLIDCYTLLVALCALTVQALTKAQLSEAVKFLQNPKVRFVILWCGSLLFALWHYYNFSFEGYGVLTVTVHLFPFFINGLLLGWLGIQLGLPWSMFVHATNNAWPFIFFG